jgi:hypothetical protein
MPDLALPRDEPPPFWLSPRPFLEPDLPPPDDEPAPSSLPEGR